MDSLFFLGFLGFGKACGISILRFCLLKSSCGGISLNRYDFEIFILDQFCLVVLSGNARDFTLMSNAFFHARSSSGFVFGGFVVAVP